MNQFNLFLYHSWFRCAIAATLLLILTTTSSAAIVDFEDLAVAPGANDIAGDRTSRGYFFDSQVNHTHITNAAFGADNGSTYLVTDDFNGTNTQTMTKVGGGVFALSQVDLAEWSSIDGASHFVDVTGNLSGGGTVVKTFTLDLIFDTTGPLVDFQTFAFDSSWTNLISAVFKGRGSTSGDDYFAMDNINVNVPEPVTVSIVGTAAVFVLGCGRRRRAVAAA